MSEEKKAVELKEELEKVSGGELMHHGTELKTIQLVCPDCGYVLGEYLETGSYVMGKGGLYCPVCKKAVLPKEIEKQ